MKAGISRLWGGIHVPADDFAGRIMGSQIGKDAYEYAGEFFVSSFLQWHNRVNDTDVNLDGLATPLDAVNIINELIRRDFSSALTGELMDPEGVPTYFYDTNDDGIVNPQDVIRVINDLVGESAPAAPLSFAVVPEPATGSIVLFALLAGSALRRRYDLTLW